MATRIAGTGANAMGEEAFDEVVIAARRGTLFIRGGYGRKELWLGLAKDQVPDGDPDIVIELTPLMRTRLVEALTSMPATAETEDDAEDITVGLAPVRCGHGIAHDESCARCAAPEAE